MAPPVRALVLVSVLVGVVTTPLAAAGGLPASSAAADGNATDPQPGAHLAGVVATQDSTVRGVVAGETFRTRLANADSDRERAVLIDDRLTVIERRLTAVERRLRTLSEARENGSLSDSAYTARVAALGATADRLAEATDAITAAAGRLPEERRVALNISDRVADIRRRTAAVRERTSAATDTIEGVGTEVRATPVSLADVEEAARRGVRVPQSLRFVAGTERINLYVRRANGTTPVYAVEIVDGRTVSVSEGGFENPTLAVYTDYRVIGEIQRADDPVAAVEAAIADGRIRYDGKGFVNSLVYGTLKLVSLLAGGLL